MNFSFHNVLNAVPKKLFETEHNDDVSYFRNNV